MRVMVVDDNTESLDAATSFLEHLGHSTMLATSASAALESMAVEKPDLIISDLEMPGGNGIDLLKVITTNFPHLPFSIFTGRAAVDNAIEALRLGAFDYILKPLDLDTLSACLMRVERHLALFSDLKDAKNAREIIEKMLQKQEAAASILESQNKTLEALNSQLASSQRQVVQSEKMAAIGQLSAGVAHEIKNPVQFVRCNLEALGEYGELFRTLIDKQCQLKGMTGSDRDKVLDEICQFMEAEDIEFVLDDLNKLVLESKEGMGRIQEIVDTLKEFARPDKDVMVDADLNKGIEATLTIIWNELKYTCEVHKELQPLPPIKCFPSQLNQVFMNLLVNAGHAIKDKGNITIRSEERENEVVVSILDDGHGMSEETMSKIFDPFFTTKEAGKGTGLGLAISNDIITKHGGRLEVESEIGKGTRFHVILPKSQPED